MSMAVDAIWRLMDLDRPVRVHEIRAIAECMKAELETKYNSGYSDGHKAHREEVYERLMGLIP